MRVGAKGGVTNSGLSCAGIEDNAAECFQGGGLDI